MTFEIGTLVHARDRDWVVLPGSEDGWLRLRPLGGIESETVDFSPDLEPLTSAHFFLPDAGDIGDLRSCALLRDAVRLGLRATTGPFRCFGHIAVEPRPYQLVPLLMALKQPVTRLLIADDVGIGKTVEALLIARELLDRGEIRRCAVLCPPQLAEQWQREMADKFHIDARLVLPSTIARLEKGLDAGTSLFEAHPFTIVSLEFIKSERHRADFLRACPELVIIDEAHACGAAGGGRGRKQRYDLVRELALDRDRHMIFVTATPHTGKEDVFRSLLAFLNPELRELPADLSGKENTSARQQLARYFIQRRRGDIRRYVDTETPFPVRKTMELTWSAGPAWQKLFDDVLSLARDTILSKEGASEWVKRISWWSALALLRAVSSSPAAALETLQTRAIGTDVDEPWTLEQLNAQGMQSLLDLETTDEIFDSMPGADIVPADADGACEHGSAAPSGSAGPLQANEKTSFSRRRYSRLAAQARALMGVQDEKLQSLIPHLKALLNDGWSPVVFCRFIPTAEYLAEQLRSALPGCEVQAVTGRLEPAARKECVTLLAGKEQRLLVCTDCLSEGINLQTSFNAVVHYDLSWNPTRHEQREGRVDRYGQSRPEVRVITWWGKENRMDGMILNVLLRKHQAIRNSLGISVPVPENVEAIVETLIQGLLLRKAAPARLDDMRQQMLPGVRAYLAPQIEQLTRTWDKAAADVQKRSNTFFAQQSIKVDDVVQCLAEAGAACGTAQTVESFVSAGLRHLGGVMKQHGRGGRSVLSFNFDEHGRSRHPGLRLPGSERFVFSLPVGDGETLLTRTDPFVEQLASYLVEISLDPHANDRVARAGAIRTKSVSALTVLLLCRFRFRLRTSGAIQHESLAEECAMLAYRGVPHKAVWLPEAEIAGLLSAEADGNVGAENTAIWIDRVRQGFSSLHPQIKKFCAERARALENAHRKVRDAAKQRNLRYAVSPQGEPDVLGIYVFLPPAR